MSATRTYYFNDYTLRPADLGDIALAVRWTAADADHVGRTHPDFWVEQTLSNDSYLLLDKQGPLFFFKLHRITVKSVELHIQFPPLPGNQGRILVGLIDGCDWLDGMLKGSRIEEVFFMSANESLVRFASRRLGYAQDGSRLAKRVNVGV
jgi:hypothetical protein